MTEPDSRSKADVLEDILLLLEELPDEVVEALVRDWQRLAREKGWLPPPQSGHSDVIVSIQ